VVLALRFNQPVSIDAALPHLHFDFAPHDFPDPVLPPEARARLQAVDPKAVEDFEAKVARARQAASSREAVPVSAAAEWDRKSYPPGSDLLVFQTDAVPPTDGWIRVSVDGGIPGVQGPATPGQPQEYVVKLERTFFVEDFRCRTACDPDDYNPLRLRTSVKPASLRRVLKVSDVTDPAKETPLVAKKRASTAPDEEAELDEDDRPYDRTAPSPSTTPVSLAPGGRTWWSWTARWPPRTARCSATPGPARSRTGTSPPSAASAAVMACGSRARERSSRSMRATCSR
jgi:hypothetical protein